jgi:iron complex transport system ATP-binding protein
MGTVPTPPPGAHPSARRAQGADARGSRAAAGARAATPSEPTVHVDHVTVAYGRILAVDDADLTFHAGETVAIIGPNGSGKSTLLSTISGLVKPTRGAVRLAGGGARRRRVAHVLQTTIANDAVPLTVLETVRMGCYGRRGAFRPLTAADRSAISDAVDRMQLGDLVDRQLRELSGGQRQRTYVAQGLVQRSDVLLLDEPITGLDLVTQETITQMMRDERARGTTVVLTTHDVGTAMLADTAVLMATQVVATGTPSDTLTPEHLATAYGGHVHVLPDGTVVLDESHHHDHRHHDQL